MQKVLEEVQCLVPRVHPRPQPSSPRLALSFSPRVQMSHRHYNIIEDTDLFTFLLQLLFFFLTQDLNC